MNTSPLLMTFFLQNFVVVTSQTFSNDLMQSLQEVDVCVSDHVTMSSLHGGAVAQEEEDFLVIEGYLCFFMSTCL